MVITDDPRASHRPAEAIRIAAGVGAWEQVEITLYLHGPAILALSQFTEELVHEEAYTQYLPMVARFGRPIFVQREALLLPELGETPWAYEEISENQLAALTARTNCVVHF